MHACCPGYQRYFSHMQRDAFGVGLLTSHSLQLQKQIKNRLQALTLRGLKMRAELVTRIKNKVTPAGNWKGFPASLSFKD